MAICEICGIEFDDFNIEDEFYDAVTASCHPLSYDNFGKTICCDCAVDEYERGNYFEQCTDCGKRFYPEEEYNEFNYEAESHGIFEADMWEEDVLCAECALKRLEKAVESDYENGYTDRGWWPEDDEDDDDD